MCVVDFGRQIAKVQTTKSPLKTKVVSSRPHRPGFFWSKNGRQQKTVGTPQVLDLAYQMHENKEASVRDSHFCFEFVKIEFRIG